MPDENTPFELPDVMPTDPTELGTLEAAARAAFEARYDQGASTPEDLEELQGLAENVRQIRAAILASEVGEPVEPEVVPEPEVTPEPEVVPEPEPEPAPAEPVEQASPAGAVLDALLLTPPASAPPAEVTAPAPVAVAPTPAPEAAPAAPAPAPAPVSIAAAVEAPVEFEMAIAQPNPITIVASADIPGVPASSEIVGMDGLVKAITAKCRSLPISRGTTGDKGYPVATINKPLSSDRNLDGISEVEMFERMADLSSPAFLLASGGWCAPEETIYTFACEVEAPPDMVVLPTFSTSRGSVRYPISPTFGDFMSLENNGLFTWTNEDDIAAGESGGPTKPCFHIPCVDFDTCMLELEGLCVTAGNLTSLAYPELIRRYLSLVLTGHLHRMNTQKILKMLALVDDTVTIPATFAAASALLDALLLQVADLRDQFSMSEGSLIEGMAPRWLRGPIKADVARRECCSIDSLSNAEVDAYLRSSGVSLQFVSNWQPMGDPDNPATVWPTEVQILLWLPGALRELTGPSLDINVARDSVLNATNDHSVTFTEESYQICKPGCGVRLVEIPICPSGASGERVELVCAGS